MVTVYEGMFLLDNQVVREDWNRAKTLVTGTIEKHGGKILTARRWDERALAYPIQGKKRATYLITYYELPGDVMPATRRDFDLSEPVLRYLWLKVDGVPEEEQGLSDAENADDFSVPEPPEDDAPEPEEEQPEEEKAAEGSDKAEGDDAKAEDAKAEDAKAEDAKAAPAEGGDEPAKATADTATESAPKAAADEGSKEN